MQDTNNNYIPLTAQVEYAVILEYQIPIFRMDRQHCIQRPTLCRKPPQPIYRLFQPVDDPPRCIRIAQLLPDILPDSQQISPRFRRNNESPCKN